MTIPIPDMKDDEAVAYWIGVNTDARSVDPQDVAALRSLCREVARKVAEEAYEAGYSDGMSTNAPLKVTRDDVVTTALDAVCGPATEGE